jgi:hypothetical protein
MQINGYKTYKDKNVYIYEDMVLSKHIELFYYQLFELLNKSKKERITPNEKGRVACYISSKKVAT